MLKQGCSKAIELCLYTVKSHLSLALPSRLHCAADVELTDWHWWGPPLSRESTRLDSSDTTGMGRVFVLLLCQSDFVFGLDLKSSERRCKRGGREGGPCRINTVIQQNSTTPLSISACGPLPIIIYDRRALVSCSLCVSPPFICSCCRCLNRGLSSSFYFSPTTTTEYARLQFKEFVNTLATIQQQPAEEGGEKFLVLKAKFLPTPPQAAMMMQFQHHQPPPPPTLLTNTNYMQQSHLAPMMMRAPPPYRPPPEPRRSSTNSLSASPVSAANGSSSFQFNHQPSPPPPSSSYQQQQGHRLPPPPPPSNSNSNFHQQQQQQQFAPLMNRQASVGSIGDFIPASVYLSSSVQDLTSSSSSSSLSQLNGAPVVPPRGRLRSSSHSNENNKENNNGSDMTTSSSLGSLTGSAGGGGGSIDGGIGGAAAASGVGGEVKISVKERTQRFNKMASEVDLLGIGVGGKGTLTDGGDNQQLHNNRHKTKVCSLKPFIQCHSLCPLYYFFFGIDCSQRMTIDWLEFLFLFDCI